MIKLLPSLAALCVAATVVSARAQAADDALFRALGGQPGIDAVVDDFVPRLVADPRLSEFFKKAKQPHLKAMLSLQFCAVAGGGCVYAGQAMAAAHHDMDISKADFNALVEVLQASMDAQHVPFATQNQLLARLAPMHRDIVH